MNSTYCKICSLTGGSSLEVPLENRIFNYASLAISFIAMCATIINVFLEVNNALFSIAITSIILFLAFFYLSKRHNLFRVLRIPFYLSIYLIAAALWFLGGGVSSSVIFILILLIVVMIATSKVEGYLTHTVLSVLIFMSLFMMEYFHPELAVGCKNTTTHFESITFTTFLLVILITIVMCSLKLNYNKEKKYAEKKGQELKVGMVYASSIQDSLLESHKTIMSHFTDGFLIYLPKDMVSADFYWFKEKNGKKMLAVVDNIGYGLSGALLSTLGISYLHEITNQTEIDPGDVLKELRVKLKLLLKQKVKDNTLPSGMDIALMELDEQNSTLRFAGAKNPVYIIRNKQVIRIKGENLPIGTIDHDKTFDVTTFSLEKGDCIYTFTDGYLNQQGGETGKKYSISRFRELLIEISTKPMSEQRKVLMEKHVTWKGKKYLQQDDILIVGVKV